ncbi:hypothetical protein LTR16_008900, partial [Cryomyces antarcticus]
RAEQHVPADGRDGRVVGKRADDVAYCHLPALEVGTRGRGVRGPDERAVRIGRGWGFGCYGCKGGTGVQEEGGEGDEGEEAGVGAGKGGGGAVGGAPSLGNELGARFSYGVERWGLEW